MSHLCPNCQRPVYSSSLKHCGYCGAELPPDLFAETYQDDAFTPETALDAVLSHLDGVADVLRRSGRGCEGWLEEVAAYRIRLCSGEITQKKDAVVALSGRCHHQALGDANTVDYERYHQEVFELWRSCERLLRVYDKQAAS